MKFRFNPDRKTLIRIAALILLFIVLPFSLEMLFLMDLGGIDFALAFLFIFLGSSRHALLVRWESFKADVAAFVRFMAELSMFKPRVFVPHVAVSGIILSIGCSVLLLGLFWVPLIYASSGFV